MKKKTVISLLLALLCLLSGCATAASDEEVFGNKPQPTQAPPTETAPEETPEPTPEPTAPPEDAPVFIDEVSMGADLEGNGEVIPLGSSPAPLPALLLPEASGVSVAKGNGAEIDYSNVTDGYVMGRFPGASDKQLRVRVTGPSGIDYDYLLPAGKTWSTFPLSDGNGAYKVMMLQNTTGKKYAVLTTASFTAALKDEFAPFLRPNQYVNYEGAEETVKMAASLTKDIEAPLEKVGAVYNYVIHNLSYDKARAEAVINRQLVGYLPVLDSVLAEKKGICFDYAALMTGMLRSQGIPCKLVVGYAGTTYHAWVSVWTRETGWVDNAIYFDGTTWHRMDPTFASSANSSDAIMEFIGEGKNYTVKYLY